jgi:molecular chaperone DnaJ
LRDNLSAFSTLLALSALAVSHYSVPRMAKDYYQILGVSKGASEQEIKQAYRKLSRELHPDKHKGDKQKEEQFKAVNEAYEVLSDPKKKQTFDQFGTADGPFAGGGGGGGFGGFEGFDFGGGGMGDIFESFFGGAGGRRTRKNDTRGRDVEIELTVPFMDAVKGAEREISFRTLVKCATCGGGGNQEGSKVVTCPTCNGSGQVMRTARSLFGTIQQAMLCDNCGGSGKIPEKPCKTCNGEGRKEDKKTVKINIPAGIMSGQSLRVTGEGEAGKQGGTAGDLFIRMRVEEDARFTRNDDDIRTTLKIPLLDAVLGSTKDVETVHGPVSLTIPAGTQPEQVFRIKGKGMPVLNASRHGDHYVEVEVEIPKKLSRHEKELYEQLRNQA